MSTITREQLAMPGGALRAIVESLQPHESAAEHDLRIINALRMLLEETPRRYDGELYDASIKAAMPHLFDAQGEVAHG